MRLFGPHDVTDALALAASDPALLRIDPQTVHAFNSWQEGGYEFSAFQAYHAVNVFEALFYSIDDGQHSVLYATDTGPFPADTWQALAGRSFDVIILEETLANGTYTQHMGFDTFLEHAQRMRAEGMLRPGGRFIAHHMSHSGNPSHEKIEAILGPHGVEVAYDGLEITL